MFLLTKAFVLQKKNANPTPTCHIFRSPYFLSKHIMLKWIGLFTRLYMVMKKRQMCR